MPERWSERIVDGQGLPALKLIEREAVMISRILWRSVFGLLLLFAGCGTPHSTPSTLTAREKTELEDALKRLDDVLKAKAPALHANLQPPATAAEIADLRAALDGNTVETLEVWFQWHNGVSGPPSALLPLGYPMSLQETIDDRKMMADVPLVDGFRKSAVTILADGSGDGFFLDVTSPQPLVFYYMLEDGYPHYYGTLAEFVNFIADGFESGVLYVNAAGEFDYDMEQYQAKEATYLQSVTQP